MSNTRLPSTTTLGELAGRNRENAGDPLRTRWEHSSCCCDRTPPRRFWTREINVDGAAVQVSDKQYSSSWHGVSGVLGMRETHAGAEHREHRRGQALAIRESVLQSTSCPSRRKYARPGRRLQVYQGTSLPRARVLRRPVALASSSESWCSSVWILRFCVRIVCFWDVALGR